MTTVKRLASTVLTALGDVQSELVGKAVVLTDGKAGTVSNVWLDELHGMRISIEGHDGKWPISPYLSLRPICIQLTGLVADTLLIGGAGRIMYLMVRESTGATSATFDLFDGTPDLGNICMPITLDAGQVGSPGTELEFAL